MVFPACFALIKKTEVCRQKGRILRSGIIAGSPCTPEDFLEIADLLPQCSLQPSYGQTETSPRIAIADRDDPNEEGGFGRACDRTCEGTHRGFWNRKEVLGGKNGENPGSGL